MNKVKIFLILIVILAAFLRLYKLDSAPPSISWDEAAVGYNAWTIANYGKDEYGKSFPLVFRSFGDDKHPVHIYATALSVKILGFNEFTTRLPVALFGVLNVLLIFFLGRILFSSNTVGLIAALFLAVSPYNIHFSRFNHEANFVLFFFMLGIILFYLSFKKVGFFLPLSVLSFGFSFISYHPAKIVVPAIVLFLLIFYFKDVWKRRNRLLSSAVILVIFALVVSFNPQILGFARVNQTIQKGKEIENTWAFARTQNEWLGRINLILNQYSWHFSPQYLFISGDKNPRLSSQTGQFYKIDAVFLILGLLYLIYRRSKEGLMLLTWALVAPLPSSMVAEAPHAARSVFMMGSWHLISALGLYFAISLLRKPIYKWTLVFITFIILTSSLFSYLSYYYGEYVKRYAIEWQYGMKQIVEFIKQHPEYEQVFMTDVRSQPYIFFLYYLKTPLSEYLNSVVYNHSESRSYNTVAYFDRYYFDGWDPIESMPNPGVLYIVSPSQYDGLRHKSEFDVKKLIRYPGGGDAFFVVSAK